MFFHCSHTRQRWNLFSTILNGNMTTKSIWRLLYWQRHFLLELFPSEKPPWVISIWKTEPHWWKHCLTLILQGNLFSSRKFSHSSSHVRLRKRSSGQKRASQTWWVFLYLSIKFLKATTGYISGVLPSIMLKAHTFCHTWAASLHWTTLH